MLWIVIIFWVLAPAFAVWDQRKADRQAERLAEEALAEVRAGRTPRDAPPPRKLALWPYALIALGLTAAWSVQYEQGLAITLAVLVWLPFHIFIFVKRTSTLISLLLMAIMIALAIGINHAKTDPRFAEAIAHIAR